MNYTEAHILCLLDNKLKDLFNDWVSLEIEVESERNVINAVSVHFAGWR
jgi:hypothetical protein